MENFSLAPVRKAIAGLIVGVIIKYCADHNIIVDNASVDNVVNYIVAAVIGFFAVWITPRNKY